MIFFASGNISSDSYLIPIAQSIAVRCSWTLTWCLPPSGSTKANMLQVPFLLYSESVFWLSPGRTGSGCLTSSKSWYPTMPLFFHLHPYIQALLHLVLPRITHLPVHPPHLFPYLHDRKLHHPLLTEYISNHSCEVEVYFF